MEFHIRYRHSHGNLHIQAAGLFDDRAADQILELLGREYPEGGRVFIDTEQLGEIHPAGREAFSLGLGRTTVARSALFFKGVKGFEIAPDGTRVLVVDQHRKEAESSRSEGKKHHCCGRCAHCRCRHGQDAVKNQDRSTGDCR